MFLIQEKMQEGDIQKVMDMVNVSREEVVQIAEDLKTSDIVEIIAALLEVPPVSGYKYIPPKPKIDDGLTDEVREKIKKARELADILNAHGAQHQTDHSGSTVAVERQSSSVDVPVISEQQKQKSVD